MTMASQIIELDDFVFEIETTPDAPGHCRRALTVTMLSGPLVLDDEELQWLVEQVRTEVERQGGTFLGCDVEVEP
jgi:hypothetical protein